MAAWRLDEVYTEDEGGMIADLEVVPGDPAIHRRIERLERVVSERPGVWQNRVALAQALVQNAQFPEASQQLRASLELVADAQVLSALFFNLGGWAASIPGWQTPNGQHIAQPLIWDLGAYLCTFCAGVFIANGRHVGQERVSLAHEQRGVRRPHADVRSAAA